MIPGSLQHSWTASPTVAISSSSKGTLSGSKRACAGRSRLPSRIREEEDQLLIITPMGGSLFGHHRGSIFSKSPHILNSICHCCASLLSEATSNPGERPLIHSFRAYYSTNGCPRPFVGPAQSKFVHKTFTLASSSTGRIRI